MMNGRCDRRPSHSIVAKRRTHPDSGYGCDVGMVRIAARLKPARIEAIVIVARSVMMDDFVSPTAR